jgi:uncharacterized membrane protein
LGRVEAFSDGVIAIIVTIMVLELKSPENASLASLVAIWPTMLAYALSFFVVAIMWVNHHHMLRAAKRPDARLLWANNFLLFCMSLIPFVTRYLGDNHGASLPVAVYAGELAVTCAAFYCLMSVLARHNHGNEAMERQFSRMKSKGINTMIAYGLAAPMAFWSARMAMVLLILIPLFYFLPERKLLAE